MRIVAGTHRGRALIAPRHPGLRPTSDRVREALFNVLQHGIPDFELPGARVLDLFAGTGALGLEALSRGAAYAVFVDSDVEARGLMRQNIEALAFTGVTRIFRRDATRLGPVGTLAPFDLVFLDPPYGQDLAVGALGSALEGGWLAPGALAVVEEAANRAVDLPPSFVQLDRRVYGETQIMLARRPA